MIEQRLAQSNSAKFDSQFAALKKAYSAFIDNESEKNDNDDVDNEEINNKKKEFETKTAELKKIAEKETNEFVEGK